MSHNHDAIFRDPTEPAGFDARPQYPLVGPILFWDTRDHTHGATGFVTRNAGNTARIDSTGSLPNQGSAGTQGDMTVFQESLWSPAGGGLPDYARYTAEAQLPSVFLNPPTWPSSYIYNMTGGPPSVGPYTWITASGDILNAKLSIPTIGWPGTGGEDFQFEFYPNFQNGQTWTAAMNHTLTYDGVSIPNRVGFRSDSFYPGVTTGGLLASDVQGDFEVVFEDWATYGADMNNQLFVTMIDVPAGLTDSYALGSWMSDEPQLGYPPADILVVEDWYGAPGNDEVLTQGTPDRQFARRSTANALAPQVDLAYIGNRVRGYDCFMDNERRYDIGDGSAKFVAGQPFHQWRAGGLWRGTPTTADLAAIAAAMGI